jgi:hypothetical protein
LSEREKPAIPSDMKAFNRTVIEEFRKTGGELVVIASDNRAVRHPKWYRNLLAKPIATVEVRGRSLIVPERIDR